jgi:nucleotide-binding universal stress UspA family protein
MEAPSNARWIHPRGILVATDLSDLQRIMPFALQMAGDTGARLRLLHVIPASEEFTADATGMPYFDRKGALSTAKNMLQPWVDRAGKLGLECTTIIRENHAVPGEIISVVDQFHPDRLLLGTRSRSRLGKLLLGSVAEQVLRSANLPVFTVGPEACLPQQNCGQKPEVLFATTLGEGHLANAALACQFAASLRSKLVILHVLPALSKGETDGSDALLSTITYELQHLAHKIGAGSSIDVDIKVAHGSPAEQILAAADASPTNLIVMGAADHSIFDSIAQGRTVCRVLARAHCPVLSLHGSTEQRLQNENEAVAVH